LAVKCAATLPLKLLPLPIAMPPMVEMLQWHKVHDYDPANQWFRRLLRAAIDDLPHDPPRIGVGRKAHQSRAARDGRARGRGPTNRAATM
jgi:hypothetical protein